MSWAPSDDVARPLTLPDPAYICEPANMLRWRVTCEDDVSSPRGPVPGPGRAFRPAGPRAGQRGRDGLYPAGRPDQGPHAVGAAGRGPRRGHAGRDRRV